MEVGQIPLPSHIPSDLKGFERRTTVDPDSWSAAGAILIRTWYGSSEDISSEEIVTVAAADEAYFHLQQRALSLSETRMFHMDTFGPFIFDDDATMYKVMSKDADDEVELVEEIPHFVLSALMRCPDALEGCSEPILDVEDDVESSSGGHERETEQALLIAVADGEACHDGWVLLMAINDRGQVLHRRVRCKAFEVDLNVAFWKDQGVPLNEGYKNENIMDYLDANQSGNGWDE